MKKAMESVQTPERRVKVRFHCARTLSVDKSMDCVTRQVTEHVPCSLFKSMSVTKFHDLHWYGGTWEQSRRFNQLRMR
jgi:hypothetical protein